MMEKFVKLPVFSARSLVRTCRLPAYIAFAALFMVLFLFLTPPIYTGAGWGFLTRVPGLSGDYPLYLTRFLLSFVLLGVLPLCVALAWGDKPSALGLRFSAAPLRWYHLAVFSVVAFLFGVSGAFSDGLYRYYPYSHSLVLDVLEKGWAAFLPHAFLYGFLYYLPWEFFFRGFLLLPMARELEERAGDPRSEDRTAPGGSGSGGGFPALMAAIVAFQTIPSTLLHFGHPFAELLSAIPAGLFFGWLAYRTRSIFPGLLLHFLVGMGTDITIIFLQRGTP